MENGEVRHVTVRDGATATVDGKVLTVKDLKPGMKLQRTLTTTTTPKTVTTVRTITGKVFNVIPPNTLILSFPDGSPKQAIPDSEGPDVHGGWTKEDRLRLKTRNACIGHRRHRRRGERDELKRRRDRNGSRSSSCCKAGNASATARLVDRNHSGGAAADRCRGSACACSSSSTAAARSRACSPHSCRRRVVPFRWSDYSAFCWLAPRLD
jgi:hypothetical protein